MLEEWGNWGQGWDAEAGAKLKIAIVQKPFYMETTYRLPYELLVEATNAWLPQNKIRIFVPQVRRERFSGRYVFQFA